ncbi:NACHT domain-containing protein, partial [Loigolactobacillus coryniformis]|uniref:NACHT domain-containing protein n=1 Tax=Loigolactobacillus coryniformis TaxID=1610 RepID=UPI00201A75BB
NLFLAHPTLEDALTDTIEPDHLFRDPHVRRVLALGQPGMGKTALTHQLCRLWCQRHLPFRHVFRIVLRQINDEYGSVSLPAALQKLFPVLM